MSLRAGEQVKNEVEAHSGGFPARDSFITEPVAEWAVFPSVLFSCLSGHFVFCLSHSSRLIASQCPLAVPKASFPSHLTHL